MIETDALAALRQEVRAAYRMDEAACVKARLEAARLPLPVRRDIEAKAVALVEAMRAEEDGPSGLDAFLESYNLASEEGVLLLCLAEALLRVPDAATADKLIQDKIGGARWERHLGLSDSLLVNASTYALMLTGRVVSPVNAIGGRGWAEGVRQVVGRLGAPVVRAALVQGMRILGHQFVLGRSIEEALERAAEGEAAGYRYSFDMLGEAARTAADATRYFDAYAGAIRAVGASANGRGPEAGPGVSVKLSALHPRYEFAKGMRIERELIPRTLELARLARDHGIGFTIDAEEAERLEPSLAVVEALAREPSLRGWDGLGLAVQAYQKRALPLVDWLATLAEGCGRRLIVRLVKGAYWDSEIKHAQVNGLAGYAVFTRKASTDVSYLACARRMLDAGAALYPAFATHNAHTLTAVLELAGARTDFELQRLHGMGERLYALSVEGRRLSTLCRVYAPVGGHEALLAYLVRRLLENGANTSFVNRVIDRDVPAATVVADPLARLESLAELPNPSLPLPSYLYGEARDNAKGIDLSDPLEREQLVPAVEAAWQETWHSAPVIGGERSEGTARPITDPADRRVTVGEAVEAGAADAVRALGIAAAAQPGWDAVPAAERGAILRSAADNYEREMPRLMALAIAEAGKAWPDAIAEVREAVDYLRYYAGLAEAEFASPSGLPGPTGERNTLALRGRGAFLCISPWNFPLAIFTGQVAAALAAGNAVLAKPAEQTPLIAAEGVRLLHEAGVPAEVLHFLPGDGPALGGASLPAPGLAGVAFTGSTEVARLIARQLAARDGPILPLIAETGGQNAMIVDSTALPEQVIRDVLASAFNSAGQRCSALRVLFLQEDVAPDMIEMLAGAMAELEVGSPRRLVTDIGPVIDEEARQTLENHAARMEREGRLIARVRLGEECRHGSFFAPVAYEIDSIARLEREVFGPILHVVRYGADALDQVIDAINATGYGLTLGVHSRIEATVRHVAARARVGNLYVNRGQIGAVVGVQPFGGEGLSGTGPKAGGPHYLHRFATERTVSIDTTAAGGNAALLAQEED
ncbi:MAG: bifunctional proline dehydrogenase/L-glutamate gamma-semialdehyde dehydrogenase PutA [Alphaproteobacteria bacterium]